MRGLMGWLLVCVIPVVWPTLGIADWPAGYEWQRTALTISTGSPPVQMFVEDVAGRRSGVDPALGLTWFGTGQGINEIPLSQAMGANTRNDETGEPSVESIWQVNMMDSGAQTYTIHVQGITTGFGWVRIGMLYERDLGLVDLPVIHLNVLVTPGVERLLTVVFNPDSRIMTSRRVVAPGDLAQDLDAACATQFITAEGVCQSLKAKAAAVAAALGRGNKKAARGVLKAFLAELKAQGGTHVREPVLTILREEAEALLNPPSLTPKPKSVSKGTPKK